LAHVLDAIFNIAIGAPADNIVTSVEIVLSTIYRFVQLGVS